ncbi:orotidine-5'-phosphate decarboxylase [Leptotrichia sp. OH3620_COT-345]|uniref:orotidine-5'-phosphate decarboxylase n=1 Tax=Leptotrichia sp. OH3620_COT-345 TaxID=2491048 RepID=UPI000F6483D0|nr:orotidine-5'-phosphate decarboxylase [Leptotrichia sp. OH3620_COT-345]RRD39011.1 orotidine-5'-phosphate decarboxylase [Leptotrichia sp. OH3620_COT-345]
MKKINCKAKEKLIIALDYNNFEEAKKLVESLGENISIYKVGLEIFLNTEGKIVDYLHSKKKKVFLDLKFHDITNTVKTACEYAIKKNVFMFNIHCSSGMSTMKEISELLKKYNSASILIGVTILTNLSENDIQEMFGGKIKLEELVLNMASLAKKSGMNGIVCSPKEARTVKEKLGKDFVTVCPGVRPEFTLNCKDDQNRIMTPYEAVKNGADFLVVGRPVTKNENPENVVKIILEEISECI